MKSPQFLAVLALAFLVTPLLGQSGDEDRLSLREDRRFYFTLIGGLAFPMDGTFTVDASGEVADEVILNPGPPPVTEIQTETVTSRNNSPDLTLENGFVGAIAFGAYLGSFRAELEFGFHMGDIESFDFLLDSGDYDLIPNEDFNIDLGGEHMTQHAMANVFYDFPLAEEFFGYVGLGIGATRITIKGGDIGENESDTLLSAQLMAGVIFPMTEAFDVQLGYRLYATEDFTFSASNSDARTDIDSPDTTSVPVMLEVNAEIPLIHSVEIAFRFSF